MRLESGLNMHFWALPLLIFLATCSISNGQGSAADPQTPEERYKLIKWGPVNTQTATGQILITNPRGTVLWSQQSEDGSVLRVVKRNLRRTSYDGHTNHIIDRNFALISRPDGSILEFEIPITTAQQLVPRASLDPDGTFVTVVQRKIDQLPNGYEKPLDLNINTATSLVKTIQERIQPDQIITLNETYTQKPVDPFSPRAGAVVKEVDQVFAPSTEQSTGDDAQLVGPYHTILKDSVDADGNKLMIAQVPIQRTPDGVEVDVNDAALSSHIKTVLRTIRPDGKVNTQIVRIPTLMPTIPVQSKKRHDDTPVPPETIKRGMSNFKRDYPMAVGPEGKTSHRIFSDVVLSNGTRVIITKYKLQVNPDMSISTVDFDNQDPTLGVKTITTWIHPNGTVSWHVEQSKFQGQKPEESKPNARIIQDANLPDGTRKLVYRIKEAKDLENKTIDVDYSDDDPETIVKEVTKLYKPNGSIKTHIVNQVQGIVFPEEAKKQARVYGRTDEKNGTRKVFYKLKVVKHPDDIETPIDYEDADANAFTKFVNKTYLPSGHVHSLIRRHRKRVTKVETLESTTTTTTPEPTTTPPNNILSSYITPDGTNVVVFTEKYRQLPQGQEEILGDDDKSPDAQTRIFVKTFYANGTVEITPQEVSPPEPAPSAQVLPEIDPEIAMIPTFAPPVEIPNETTPEVPVKVEPETATDDQVVPMLPTEDATELPTQQPFEPTNGPPEPPAEVGPSPNVRIERPGGFEEPIEVLPESMLPSGQPGGLPPGELVDADAFTFEPFVETGESTTTQATSPEALTPLAVSSVDEIEGILTTEVPEIATEPASTSVVAEITSTELPIVAETTSSDPIVIETTSTEPPAFVETISSELPIVAETTSSEPAIVEAISTAAPSASPEPPSPEVVLAVIETQKQKQPEQAGPVISIPKPVPPTAVSAAIIAKFLRPGKPLLAPDTFELAPSTCACSPGRVQLMPSEINPRRQILETITEPDGTTVILYKVKMLVEPDGSLFELPKDDWDPAALIMTVMRHIHPDGSVESKVIEMKPNNVESAKQKVPGFKVPPPPPPVPTIYTNESIPVTKGTSEVVVTTENSMLPTVPGQPGFLSNASIIIIDKTPADSKRIVVHMTEVVTLPNGHQVYIRPDSSENGKKIFVLTEFYPDGRIIQKNITSEAKEHKVVLVALPVVPSGTSITNEGEVLKPSGVENAVPKVPALEPFKTYEDLVIITHYVQQDGCIALLFNTRVKQNGDGTLKTLSIDDYQNSTYVITLLQRQCMDGSIITYRVIGPSKEDSELSWFTTDFKVKIPVRPSEKIYLPERILVPGESAPIPGGYGVIPEGSVVSSTTKPLQSSTRSPSETEVTTDETIRTQEPESSSGTKRPEGHTTKPGGNESLISWSYGTTDKPGSKVERPSTSQPGRDDESTTKSTGTGMSRPDGTTAESGSETTPRGSSGISYTTTSQPGAGTGKTPSSGDGSTDRPGAAKPGGPVDIDQLFQLLPHGHAGTIVNFFVQPDGTKVIFYMVKTIRKSNEPDKILLPTDQSPEATYVAYILIQCPHGKTTIQEVYNPLQPTDPRFPGPWGVVNVTIPSTPEDTDRPKIPSPKAKPPAPTGTSTGGINFIISNVTDSDGKEMVVGSVPDQRPSGNLPGQSIPQVMIVQETYPNGTLKTFQATDRHDLNAVNVTVTIPLINYRKIGVPTQTEEVPQKNPSHPQSPYNPANLIISEYVDPYGYRFILFVVPSDSENSTLPQQNVPFKTILWQETPEGFVTTREVTDPSLYAKPTALVDITVKKAIAEVIDESAIENPAAQSTTQDPVAALQKIIRTIEEVNGIVATNYPRPDGSFISIVIEKSMVGPNRETAPFNSPNNSNTQSAIVLQETYPNGRTVLKEIVTPEMQQHVSPSEKETQEIPLGFYPFENIHWYENHPAASKFKMIPEGSKILGTISQPDESVVTIYLSPNDGTDDSDSDPLGRVYKRVDYPDGRIQLETVVTPQTRPVKPEDVLQNLTIWAKPSTIPQTFETESPLYKIEPDAYKIYIVRNMTQPDGSKMSIYVVKVAVRPGGSAEYVQTNQSSMGTRWVMIIERIDPNGIKTWTEAKEEGKSWPVLPEFQPNKGSNCDKLRTTEEPSPEVTTELPAMSRVPIQSTLELATTTMVPAPEPVSSTLQPAQEPATSTLQPTPELAPKNTQPIPELSTSTIQPTPEPATSTLQPIPEPATSTLQPIPEIRPTTIQQIPEARATTMQPIPEIRTTTTQQIPEARTSTDQPQVPGSERRVPEQPDPAVESITTPPPEVFPTKSTGTERGPNPEPTKPTEPGTDPGKPTEQPATETTTPRGERRQPTEPDGHTKRSTEPDGPSGKPTSPYSVSTEPSVTAGPPSTGKYRPPQPLTEVPWGSSETPVLVGSTLLPPSLTNPTRKPATTEQTIWPGLTEVATTEQPQWSTLSSLQPEPPKSYTAGATMVPTVTEPSGPQVWPPQPEAPAPQVWLPQPESPAAHVWIPQPESPAPQVWPPQPESPAPQVWLTQPESPAPQVWPPQPESPAPQVWPTQPESPAPQVWPPQPELPAPHVPQPELPEAQVWPPQPEPPVAQVWPPHPEPPAPEPTVWATDSPITLPEDTTTTRTVERLTRPTRGPLHKPPLPEPPVAHVWPPQPELPAPQVWPRQPELPVAQVRPPQPEPPAPEPPVWVTDSPITLPEDTTTTRPVIRLTRPTRGPWRKPPSPPLPEPPVAQVWPPQPEPPVAQVWPPQPELPAPEPPAWATDSPITLPEDTTTTRPVIRLTRPTKEPLRKPPPPPLSEPPVAQVWPPQPEPPAPEPPVLATDSPITLPEDTTTTRPFIRLTRPTREPLRKSPPPPLPEPSVAQVWPPQPEGPAPEPPVWATDSPITLPEDTTTTRPVMRLTRPTRKPLIKPTLPPLPEPEVIEEEPPAPELPSTGVPNITDGTQIKPDGSAITTIKVRWTWGPDGSVEFLQPDDPRPGYTSWYQEHIYPGGRMEQKSVPPPTGHQWKSEGTKPSKPPQVYPNGTVIITNEKWVYVHNQTVEDYDGDIYNPHLWNQVSETKIHPDGTITVNMRYEPIPNKPRVPPPPPTELVILLQPAEPGRKVLGTTVRPDGSTVTYYHARIIRNPDGTTTELSPEDKQPADGTVLRQRVIWLNKTQTVMEIQKPPKEIEFYGFRPKEIKQKTDGTVIVTVQRKILRSSTGSIRELDWSEDPPNAEIWEKRKVIKPSGQMYVEEAFMPVRKSPVVNNQILKHVYPNGTIIYTKNGQILSSSSPDAQPSYIDYSKYQKKSPSFGEDGSLTETFERRYQKSTDGTEYPVAFNDNSPGTYIETITKTTYENGDATATRKLTRIPMKSHLFQFKNSTQASGNTNGVIRNIRKFPNGTSVMVEEEIGESQLKPTEMYEAPRPPYPALNPNEPVQDNPTYTLVEEKVNPEGAYVDVYEKRVRKYADRSEYDVPASDNTANTFTKRVTITQHPNGRVSSSISYVPLEKERRMEVSIIDGNYVRINNVVRNMNEVLREDSPEGHYLRKLYPQIQAKLRQRNGQ